MNLKQSLLITIILSIIGLTAWEMYWRQQGYYPTLNDDKALWAMHRADVEIAGMDDYIIIGASRAYFDFQIKEFQEVTGKRPIQLSSTGSSPLPIFHDIVNNTNFDGTIILGITPGLFFSTTYPEAPPWKRPQSKVNYFKDRTYAQRINYQLSIPLQQNLVFMSADEEEWTDDIDLKSILRLAQFGNRSGGPMMPPFYNFGDVSAERNMSMRNRTVTDTVYANTIKKVWGFYGKGAHPPDKVSTIAYFLEDLAKFKARKGNLILVRCPSSGGTRVGENMGLPRADYWDDLVGQAQVSSYHFEDYNQFKNLECPEESHLSTEDAQYFTLELAKIMKADGVLFNPKSN